jgi:hypothetical protein
LIRYEGAERITDLFLERLDGVFAAHGLSARDDCAEIRASIAANKHRVYRDDARTVALEELLCARPRKPTARDRLKSAFGVRP